MRGYLHLFVALTTAFLLDQGLGSVVKSSSRNDENPPWKGYLRSAICPIIYEHSVQRVSSLEPRIVNGDLASDKVSPAVVAFYKQGVSSICTGTLVSKRWVITAAHCGIDATSGYVAAVLMKNSYASDSSNVNGSWMTIRSAYIHDQYIQNDVVDQQYDVAAVELATDVPEGATPMKLNTNTMVPEVHSYVRVLGFGVQSEESTEMSRPLSQVDLPVVSGTLCAHLYENVEGIEISDQAQICAGYVDRGGCDSW